MARSGFAVAPWENWTDTGHIDDERSPTGFHWGRGSEMARVEMMPGILGNVFVNVERRRGWGSTPAPWTVFKSPAPPSLLALGRSNPPRNYQPAGCLLVRFAGIDRNARYEIVVNGG